MLDDKQIIKLRKSFPDETIQSYAKFKDPDTGATKHLTGVKPQYIVERLNDVFGHEGWDFEIIKHGLEGKDAWVYGRLTIYETKRDTEAIDGPLIRKIMTVKEQFGSGKFNSATGFGDAMKSAATNSLDKCASWLDIAHEAYKGLVEIPESHPDKEGSEIEKAKLKLATLCKKHTIEKASFPTLIKSALKEDKNPKDLSLEDMNKLIVHLEKNGAPF